MNRQTESNHRPGPWEVVSNENGIRTVKIPNFRSFFEFVDRGFGDFDTTYLWRGQQNAEWKVLSKLARTGKEEFGHLANYRKAIAKCTNIEYDISSENPNAEHEKQRLWSLGQHHGLATPLIDWSVYPYVALFFAFAETSETLRERAVYALNWGEVQGLNFHIVNPWFSQFKEKINNPPYDDAFKCHLHEHYDGNFPNNVHLIDESQLSASVRDRLCKWELTRLQSQRLELYTSQSSDNPRIHHQGGMHIFTPGDISVEEWVEKYSSIRHEGLSKIPILVKIQMPNAERTNILRSLNKMNINYLSLFPDFEGAAKHCNMALLEQEPHRMGLREY